MTEPAMHSERYTELRAALGEVTERIAAACRCARRDPAEVALLPVTKTFPATDNALLADLGIRAFGENRVQSAATKVAEFDELRPDHPVRWSMVGQLQRNKVRSAARWAGEVQSVDSTRLAVALGNATGNAITAGERADPLEVLVQVCLDRQPGRGGCMPEDLPAVAEAVAGCRPLRLRGLMAVAPLDAEPGQAFERLAGLAAWLRERYPEASRLSAGMSGDLETAVQHGSTCVRVGTALLGGRALTLRAERRGAGQ